MPAKASSTKKKSVRKAPTKAATKSKPAVKKTTAKKPVAKKSVAKKVTAKKPVAKKSVAKKAIVKKVTAKKPVAKKTTVKKAPVQKTAPKKVSAANKKNAVKSTAPKNKNKETKVTMTKKDVNVKLPNVAKPAPKMSKQSVAEKVEQKKSAPMPIEETYTTHEITGPVPSIAIYVAKPGEEYMSEAQLDHFQEVLVAWRLQVMEGADKTVGHLRDDAENYADPNDRATQEEEFSLELRTRDRERKLLKKIEGSIKRIREDDFGYCNACGVEIGSPRLEVRPTATLCIDCKTVEEIREKQVTL
jgi:DnaK suppressor protein